MTDKYYLAKKEKMEIRKVIAEEFYEAILDPEEIPYIVTDDASLYDIFVGDDNELIEKVKQKYGVTIKQEHFKIPFLELLDFLKENRIK